MREDICTIPVSEVFEPKEGCPFCRMRDEAERRGIDYIMGPAMMEPDVRVKTNELGFCADHFAMLQKENGRLALALMLESHLLDLEERLFAPNRPALLRPSPKKQRYRAARVEETCFLCDRMEYGMSRMLATVYRLYDREPEFRTLFSAQPQFCLPHYRLLLDGADAALGKDRAAQLKKTAGEIMRTHLKALGADLRHFCSMFDYRNNDAGADWGTSRDVIERTVGCLTSRTPR